MLFEKLSSLKFKLLIKFIHKNNSEPRVTWIVTLDRLNLKALLLCFKKYDSKRFAGNKS